MIVTTDQERMDMMVEEAIKKQKQKYREASKDLHIWHNQALRKDSFWKLLKSYAEAFMAERGYFQPFVVDDDNREIITQMWYYIIGSEQCRWDINKGIFMGGKVGCGKTILMHAFCEVLHFISGRTVEMIPAQELCQMIAEKGFDGFASRPLLIDEIGRETLEMNAFGNKIHPIKDLLAMRYNRGARTFFTSNFKLGTLSRWRDEKGTLIGYGSDIGDRIGEMTTIVEMPGESRRPNKEEKTL